MRTHASTAATATAPAPAAIPGRSREPSRAIRRRSTARPRSSAAPKATSPFNPSRGIPTCVAATTPAMAPTVLAAYTAPMLFSPAPWASRVKVIRGRVIPAQKVAGNITSSDSEWLARLNRTYPSPVRLRPFMIAAMSSKQLA